MDKSGGPGWNCIVGKNFGAHVIHQAKKYVFLQMRELSVLLWKAWLGEFLNKQTSGVIIFGYDWWLCFISLFYLRKRKICKDVLVKKLK